MAFFDVVLRLSERITHELEGSRLVEILDRKNRFKNFLQAEILALRWGNFPLQKQIVGILLNFN